MITRYVWGLVVLSAALGGFRCDGLLSAPVQLRAVPAANPIVAAGSITLVAEVQQRLTGQRNTKVEFYRDDALVHTDDEPPYEYKWDVTRADNGSHRWRATAHIAADVEAGPVTDEWRSNPLQCTVQIATTRDLPPGPTDLGDLQIPPERVPRWDPGIEGGIPDTSAWPVINALDHGAIPNDGGDDAPAINAAINAAADAGGFRVVYLPPGTYRFARGSSIVLRSSVVLRGAGIDQTTITGDQGRVVAYEWGGVHVVGSAGSDIPVVSETLGRGSDTLELGSVGGVSVGDWMFLRQDNDRSYIQHDDGAPYMTHIFRVAQVAGNSVTMDRPLRHDFNRALNIRVTRMDPIENAGLEDLKIMNDDSSPDRYIPTVVFKYAVHSWARNVHFYNGHRYHVMLRRSARNTIATSVFERLLWADRGPSPDNQYDNYSVSIEEGAIDNLVTDNVFVDLYIPVILARGANGNVFSYNFLGGPRCSHGIFFHGHYPHSNLIEGNDSDCAIMAGDNWWGQQGPRNTAFRNRLRGRGKIKTEDQTSWGDPTIADSFNLLLNSAFSIHGTPFCDYDRGSCRDFDQLMTNLWAEGNIARDVRTGESWQHYGFIESSPEPTTTLRDNFEGSGPPDPWSALSFPPSLYLAGPPDFWPVNKPWPAIGADVDDFASGNVAKLPAQERCEQLNCY